MQTKTTVRRRFRRLVRLLMMVLHYHRGMKDISHLLTTRTAVEMQWYELHVSSEARKLAFDPSLYSRERVSAIIDACTCPFKRGICDVSETFVSIERL